jgi:murein DD-endopeptidase MepM/ murein hydrolase activator NlpD
VDPSRFGTNGVESDVLAAVNVRITAENVSTAPADSAAPPQFNEIMINVASTSTIAQAMSEAGLAGRSADNIAEALATLMSGDTLKDGTKLRVSAFVADGVTDIRRLSVYNGVRHTVTVALDDRQQYVPATEPEEIALTIEDDGRVRSRAASGKLPAAYDAIYRAAFAYGLTETMAKRLVQMLAPEIDMRSAIGPDDRIDLLFTAPDGTMGATDASAILMADIHFGGQTRRLYRFEGADGAVDFYNGDGSSARQFLLRNPVPNGTFKSGFGPRRHPILGYVRMHTGADWAAPRGTPIIASGNGVVEKAGWAGAYGKQTLIRHANGYVSSYSHQTNIAKGVVPGARVRQGQVIGTVGSTGLSTGPHLHYELIVNDVKVDPMRVRLPGSKALDGEELERFEAIRDEIDRLVAEPPRTVAALATSG